MFFRFFVSVSVLSLQLSSGAYLNWRADALDAATLLQNGKTAQALNTAFQKINEGDACNVKVDNLACVKGNIATCSAGSSNTSATWQVTQQCPGSMECFALPSVRDQDNVTVVCTSERQALSIFHATGTTGGVFGEPATGDVGDACDNADENGTTDADSDNAPTTSTSSSSRTESSTTSASTITVTATATATATISVTEMGSSVFISSTVETLTISPEEASKIIADAIQPTSP